jgi:rhodanese-related sulfurtransferase
MKKLLYLILITFAFTSCQAQQKQGVEKVSPEQFSQKINNEKGQLIDVRTPKEYSSGHLENAVNIHLYDKDFEQRIDKLDKDKTVYVYCKAGGRSAEAVEVMKAKKFKHIVELDGGTDAWTEAGKSLKQ